MREVREQAAQAAFDNFDFGDGFQASEHGPWEHRPIANEVYCNVSLTAPSGSSAAAKTMTLQFTVCFAPGVDQVSDAFAIDARGRHWGQMFPKTQFGEF